MHPIRRLVATAFAITAITFSGASMALASQPSSPPGQGECDHGNSQQSCKPDPQPSNGQDCDEHGPKEGGVNEDHCSPEVTPSTSPTPSSEPTSEPTPSTAPSDSPSASTPPTPSVSPSDEPSSEPSSEPTPSTGPTGTPTTPSRTPTSTLPPTDTAGGDPPPSADRGSWQGLLAAIGAVTLIYLAAHKAPESRRVSNRRDW